MKRKGRVLGENEIALPLISRTRAESAVPLEDCGGRRYGVLEREDLIRCLILGAEIQRDKDFEEMLRRYDPTEFERLKKKYEWKSNGNKM